MSDMLMTELQHVFSGVPTEESRLRYQHNNNNSPKEAEEDLVRGASHEPHLS